MKILIKQKNKHNIQQLFLPVLTSFMAIMIVKTYVKHGVFFLIKRIYTQAYNLIWW